jgi:hypothetical protein
MKNIDKVRHSCRICDDHFAESDKFVSVRNRTNLIIGANPTLHLPGKF